MTHAEALHWYLCALPDNTETSIKLCRQAILNRDPCATGRRPVDLVLYMFIEAGDQEWHLEVNGQPSEKRKLFSEYVSAGYIKINDPVAESTARAAIKFAFATPVDMFPLEMAIRHSSVSTVVALIEDGADDSIDRMRNYPGVYHDLLDAIRKLIGDPNMVPEMVSSVTAALMRRRIAAEPPSAPSPTNSPRRRSVSV